MVVYYADFVVSKAMLHLSSMLFCIHPMSVSCAWLNVVAIYLGAFHRPVSQPLYHWCNLPHDILFHVNSHDIHNKLPHVHLPSQMYNFHMHNTSNGLSTTLCAKNQTYCVSHDNAINNNHFHWCHMFISFIINSDLCISHINIIHPNCC